jgi:ADP-ribose pyrophosphatase YjhB (NUDIX family)
MLGDLIGGIWKLLPRPIRLRLIRATQPKFTVSVAAIVTNTEGKVLLLDHVLRPGVGWGIPGGFIDPGEQPSEAVSRELFEETGIKIRDVQMVRVRTIGSHVEILFRATCDERGEVLSREIRDLGWFEVGAMPEGMSAVQRTIVEQLLAGEV